MHLKTRTTFLSVFTSVALFASFSFYLSRVISPSQQIRDPSPAALRNPTPAGYSVQHSYYVITEQQQQQLHDRRRDVNYPPADSILFPDWEVLLVLPPAIRSDQFSCSDECFCVYPNNETSPAKPSGVLPFSNRATFKCLLPGRTRRRLPFPQPILAESRGGFPIGDGVSEPPELLRWSFLAYESLSTADDVILFVKGVNNRQGLNRPPEDVHCIFGDAVKTAVTSSNQEVFRCLHPNETSIRRLFSGTNEKIKISLEVEVGEEKRIIPSVTYYAPPRRMIAGENEKALLCACTMVYNVAKFLREWIVYHSKIGVEKFILYDNGSDDDLENVVQKLLEEYNVTTISWPWPKTQEAGFSHCAMYARDSCTWMMYIDVDEFIFSPSWLNASHPSPHMLTSLLPTTPSTSSSSSSSLLSDIGQILFWCYDFGPSSQRTHPIEGVTQGYTCRQKEEQRHKSIVLIEAIDRSLFNAIHHFQLKEEYYKVKTMSALEGMVNHYKYQAWPEFKLKFRRRVSAYVVDWRQALNPLSNDRTPGLGFEPVEPKGWAERFCEVHDERLKLTARRWFGVGSSNGYKMAWQDG